MQCWNCGFENIPGLAACARCASALSLAAVAVEPPRASRWRVLTHLHRLAYGIPLHLPNPRNLAAVLQWLCPEELPTRALAWSIIPGLGHIRYGQRPFGKTVLIVWLILLVLALVCVATPWMEVCIWLMVAVHALVIVSLFSGNLCWERLLIRALVGLVVFFALDLGLYWPARWFCGRFLVPIPLMNVPAPGVLANGDGLLASGPWLRPATFQRGALVFYAIRESSGGEHNHAAVIRAGHGVDRIVGVAGDHVQLHGRGLLVNGTPPALALGPLVPQVPPGDLDVTLREGEYAIVPSQLEAQMYGLTAIPSDALLSLVVVPDDDVIGPVLCRIRPLSRFGRIQ